MADNKRIAKNTLILYGRMLITMGISLYTSRIVLNALGVTDYGVYNAVAGFIAMFALLSNSLSAAISRYITFELGKNNIERLNQIFSSSLAMLLLLGVLILAIIETGGVWFLNQKMTIPENVIKEANWVLQFSAATFILGIVSVPYNAAIIAHEHMKAFAYISILDAAAKLGIAYAITLADSQRLIWYAGLLCGLALVIRLAYSIYCRRHFSYTRFSLNMRRKVVKEIFSFAGWNFIGASSGVLRDQGVNVLINIFCGPAVNAGRGIAMQVNHAVQSFSTSFTTALNPQITKQYAAGNRKDWMVLVFRGSRFSCFLLLILSIPVFVETEPLLRIWLKTIPPYAVVFVQLILCYVLIESVSNTLITLMLATGTIRNYQLVVGGLQLLNFPLAWLALWLGYSPAYTIVISIIIAGICLVARLVMLKGMVNLDISLFLREVLLKVCKVSLLSVTAPLVLRAFLPDNIGSFLAVGFTSVVFTCLVIYFAGCNGPERELIRQKIVSIFHNSRFSNANKQN